MTYQAEKSRELLRVGSGFPGAEFRDGREELEQALLQNRVKALVATTALGMGYDKPDLAFVIHYQTPGSVVAYYQQAGRAGRALDAAYGVLLSGEEETNITDWFIKSAFPTRREVAAVLEALEKESDGLSVPEIMARVNVSKGRIEKTIALLSLESPAPIAKQGHKWQLTVATLSEEFWARAERLTALRRTEQQQMQEYVRLPFGEHMGFLVRALDGDPCGVTPPLLAPLPTWVTCIPSLRHPDLVPDFARRLADALGLPFHVVLAKTDPHPAQKSMANSTQQARNIDGSLAFCAPRLPRRGPMFLVDDLVDSRWTLTVAAWLLRSHGSGEVWPVALAQAGRD